MRNRTTKALVTVAALAALNCGYLGRAEEGQAQQASARIAPADTNVLAIHQLQPRSREALKVWSGSFNEGQPIAEKYSDFGAKISPEIFWSLPPAGTKSVVILAEDPDAQSPKPFLHWSLYNVQPGILTIREDVPNTAHLMSLRNAMQGKNSTGEIGYYGMRPPVGDKPHHFHFQVFALDTMLNLPAGADRNQLMQAMNGHVLTSGETVGTFKKAR